MPDYTRDRDAFVAEIARRQRRALWRLRARQIVFGRQRSTQAALYDATFRSDAEAVAYHYATHNDHLPDLENPVWLNEKIRWQFLHHPNPLMTLAACKLAVRDYIRFRGCRIPPPRLLAAGSRPEALLAVELPDRFVLKTAHGSGQIHVEAEGRRTPRASLVEKVRRWQAWERWRCTGELFYRGIPPRWLVEELLPSQKERLEFKIFCFMGEPAFVAVITERTDRGFKRASFDLDWKRVDFATRGFPPDPRPVPRPPELDLMLAEARRLARDFLHVRVDFLKFNGALYFSELTFASVAARLPFEPLAANVTFGARMDLDQAPLYLARGRELAALLAQGPSDTRAPVATLHGARAPSPPTPTLPLPASVPDARPRPAAGSTAGAL